MQDNHRYDDMLHMPRHISPTRRQMPMIDRAAQFSPFAALTGFDAAILEAARLTDQFTELSEDAKAALNEKLLLITETISSRPEVSVTYFRSDVLKSGGSYLTISGRVRKVDTYNRALVLEDGTSIAIDMIYDLQLS